MGKEPEENQPFLEGKLKFSCHRGISCFTACCADLRLILTPYDILRLKKRLRLPAQDFLKEFTRLAEETDSIFPMVRLRMGEDARKRCPFVSEGGCTVYEDRPGSCRLYPLGRASSVGEEGWGTREFYFLVNEPHCLGFQEEKEWTIDEWLRDQGVKLYNEMNRPWMEIVTSRSPRIRDLTGEKLGMFYMTSYNLGRFRDFVFQTKFLKAFDIPQEEVERIDADETELMRLGMRWLKFSLFGEETLDFRKVD